MSLKDYIKSYIQSFSYNLKNIVYMYICWVHWLQHVIVYQYRRCYWEENKIKNKESFNF